MSHKQFGKILGTLTPEKRMVVDESAQGTPMSSVTASTAVSSPASPSPILRRGRGLSRNKFQAEKLARIQSPTVQFQVKEVDVKM